MHALCMITVKAGMIDDVVGILSKKRKPVLYLLAVTGRADICVILQGSIHKINSSVMSFKRIPHVLSTETLLEVEVNMGW